MSKYDELMGKIDKIASENVVLEDECDMLFDMILRKHYKTVATARFCGILKRHKKNWGVSVMNEGAIKGGNSKPVDQQGPSSSGGMSNKRERESAAAGGDDMATGSAAGGGDGSAERKLKDQKVSSQKVSKAHQRPPQPIPTAVGSDLYRAMDVTATASLTQAQAQVPHAAPAFASPVNAGGVRPSYEQSGPRPGQHPGPVPVQVQQVSMPMSVAGGSGTSNPITQSTVATHTPSSTSVSPAPAISMPTQPQQQHQPHNPGGV